VTAAGALTGVVVSIAAQVGGTGVAAAAAPVIHAVGTLVTHTNQPSVAQEQVAVSPAAAGDLLAVAVETKFPNGLPAFTVASMTGGGVTHWAKAFSYQTQDGVYGQELWWGTVTQPGNATLTVDYSTGSANGNTESATSVDVQEFSSSAGAATIWSVDQFGKVDGTTPSTAPTYPTLGPSNPSNAEAYFGYMAVPQSVGAGSTPGVVYQSDVRANQVVYDPSVSGSITPTSSSAGTTWASIGMLVGASTGTADTTAPSVPTGLAVSGTPTSSSVSLSWSASSDNSGGSGVAGYRVFRDGSATPLNSSLVTATSYADTTVSGPKTYSYTVAAVDQAGNQSAPSAPVSVSTPGPSGGSGSDRLTAGQQLATGQSLASPDGRYRLIMQTDGNLVVYAPGQRPLWNSHTGGHTGARAVMQTDGNVVVYDGGGRALWSSDTWGYSGSQLVLQSDGNLVLYSSSSAALWFTGWDRGAGAPNDVLLPGQQLTAGQGLTSANGQYTLVMQSDGNVVEYTASGRALWNTGTWGRSGVRLKQQFDGNLVAYDPNRQALWNSTTWGQPNDRLIVQNDGNVVLYAAAGPALWSSRYGRTY